MIDPSELNLSALPSLSIDKRAELPPEGGVYLVRSGSIWVYVGQSVCIRKRLTEHGDRFSRYESCIISYLVCPNVEAVQIERHLKLKLQPLECRTTHTEKTYKFPIVQHRLSRNGLRSKLPQLLEEKPQLKDRCRRYGTQPNNCWQALP